MLLDNKCIRWYCIASVWLISLHRTARGWLLSSQQTRQPHCRHLLASASSPLEDNAALMNAFAGLTQSSCQLLGVKSIGVDYGLVRMGVAKTIGYQPTAVDILADLNATQVADYVVKLAKIEGASRIIIGLPLHKNGTVAEQTNLTVAFGQVLAQASLRALGEDVSVELWDERYTSKAAAARLHARNPRQALYGMLDAEAACIILEQYYNDNGKDSIQVRVEDEHVRQACLEEFEQLRKRERIEKESHLNERERLIQRRKEAILRDQQASAASPTNKKKKKKKRRR